MKGTIALVGAANSGKTFMLSRFANKILDSNHTSNLTGDRDAFLTTEFNAITAYIMLGVINSDCFECTSSTVFLRDKKIIQHILSNPLFSRFITAASKPNSLESKILLSLETKLNKLENLFPSITRFNVLKSETTIGKRKVPTYKIVSGKLSENEILEEIKALRDTVSLHDKFVNSYINPRLKFAEVIKFLMRDATSVSKEELFNQVFLSDQTLLNAIIFIDELGALILGDKWPPLFDDVLRAGSDFSKLPDYSSLAKSYFNLIKGDYLQHNLIDSAVTMSDGTSNSFYGLSIQELEEIIASILGVKITSSIVRDILGDESIQERKERIALYYNEKAYDLAYLEHKSRESFSHNLVNACKKFKDGLSVFGDYQSEEEVKNKLKKLEILDIASLREIVVAKASDKELEALGAYLSGNLSIPKTKISISNNGNCYSLIDSVDDIKASNTSYKSLLSEVELRLPLFFVEKQRGIVVISEGDRYSYSNLKLPVANMSNNSLLMFDGSEVIQIPASLSSLNSMAVIYGLIVIDSLSMDSEIHGRARLGPKGMNLAIGASLQQMTICALASGSMFLTIVREGMGSDASDVVKEIGASVYEVVQLSSSGNGAKRSFSYSLVRTRHTNGSFLFKTLMSSDIIIKSEQLKLVEPNALYSSYYGHC